MASSNPLYSVTLHRHYLSQCLDLATKSPPKPTNFRVGAILLIRGPPEQNSPQAASAALAPFNDKIISTGYTLELPGNTHAEQACLAKLASKHGVAEEHVGQAIRRELDECAESSGFVDERKEEGEDGGEMQTEVVMYVTMEPCGKRLSGNTPCVERIIGTRRPEGDGAAGTRGIDRVYFGVREPGTFVGESRGCKMMDEAGVKWELVEGKEEEILKVATEGHTQKDGYGDGDGDEEARPAQGTNVDDISEEERKRQDALPRNPKKRMMEV